MKKKLYKNRNFFLYHDNELFQFFFVFITFLVVNRKHFAKIFKCIFMFEQLHKLINDYLIQNILNIDAKNKLINFIIRDMSYLINCFKMYC